ncbi:MAG: hypothetical protein R6V12_05425 [Candidatus Hydrogenedentota bacterium]
MMDAIQRMRRERRIAIVLFAVFVVVAVLVHWVGGRPPAHFPVPPPTETLE